jgi:hypothetical protein
VKLYWLLVVAVGALLAAEAAALVGFTILQKLLAELIQLQLEQVETILERQQAAMEVTQFLAH